MNIWKSIISAVNEDKEHIYVVEDNEIYKIGKETDNPRGMNGNHYRIYFLDGQIKETRSLWFLGRIPHEMEKYFTPNAIIKEI